MTNSVTNLTFKYSGDSSSNQQAIENQGKTTDNEIISFEKQNKEAQEKKEKTKALVEKELNATPIRFGMVANESAAKKTGATVPIGQTSAKKIDKFSVEQICANIDGYEEIKDDTGFMSNLTNFIMSKFNNASTNSTEVADVAKNSASGLFNVEGMPPMSPEAVDALKKAGVFETMQGLEQKTGTDKSQAEQLKDKQKAFGRMQEIQKQMSDPNVSADVKAKLMQEAQSLFSSTPKAQQTMPAGIINTSAAVAKNMTPADIQAAMTFVQSHATGIDDEDPEFKKLPTNVQTYIRSVASDAQSNKDNGVKPADYKLSKNIEE